MGIKSNKINNNIIYHEKFVNCNKCNMDIRRLDWGHHLRTNQHKENCGSVTQFSGNVKIKSSDFMERIEVYSYTNPKEEELLIENFFKTGKIELINILNVSLQKHVNFKFNFELQCLYVKNTDEEQKFEIINHITKMRPITRADNLELVFEENVDDIKNKMSEFQERDSGWALCKILCVEININKHNILRGSNYISLPFKLMKKSACLNIRNTDNYKWSVIAALKRSNNIKKQLIVNRITLQILKAM